MGSSKWIGAAAVMAVFLAAGAQAATKTERRVADAIDVLHEFTSIPEQGIPPNLLRNAYGVAVVPGVIKVGFGFGGHYGKGVLMVRQEDGNWSNPAFITLGGGSFGWQIGAQSTDILLVFKDRRSIEDIAYGKLTLGGQASIAAGPVGRQTTAATDGALTAEIYSYSRSRGLFAGISLEGAWVGMDRYSNEEYYGSSMSPLQILDASNMPTPVAAQQLTQLLAMNTPRPDRPAIDRTARMRERAPLVEPAAGTPERESRVETFAIDPVEGGGDETTF